MYTLTLQKFQELFQTGTMRQGQQDIGTPGLRNTLTQGFHGTETPTFFFNKILDFKKI